MMPKFIYDALPFIYLAVGAWITVTAPHPIAFISGAIFGFLAIYVFWMRDLLHFHKHLR